MPVRVLFVGNSYTARNDLPRLVADLAAAADPPLEVSTRLVAAGGASLRRHWNAGVAAQAIAGERFDWVVLQEQSTLPLKNAQRYHENVRLFDEAIRRQGSRTALYLTWARANAPQAQTALTAAVEAIARELDARIVPVGVAWQDVLQQASAPALHAPDGSHPTHAGSYLAACTFVATLFGQRPQRGAVAERLGIDASAAGLLEDAAWRAATAVATS